MFFTSAFSGTVTARAAGWSLQVHHGVELCRNSGQRVSGNQQRLHRSSQASFSITCLIAEVSKESSSVTKLDGHRLDVRSFVPECSCPSAGRLDVLYSSLSTVERVLQD